MGAEVVTTQTLTLAEFLLARVGEDEEMARAALPHFPGEVEIVANVWEDACAHIARHDPARVLAECEAKRRIVEEYEGAIAAQRGRTDASAIVGAFALLSAIRALASVYSDHPTFRDEWRG